MISSLQRYFSYCQASSPHNYLQPVSMHYYWASVYATFTSPVSLNNVQHILYNIVNQFVQATV